MPQVSVIIPTHNRATYLKGAIASVLNQTFRDFELIVVDDASTDETIDVVQSFSDTRIKYIRHEKQRGGAAARNTGIRASSCDYVAFLDDDDEWFPEKLGRQTAVLLACPATVGCVYTGYLIVERMTGRTIGSMAPTLSGDLSAALLSTNHIGGTSSVLLRRHCLKSVGIFDESLPSFQDYDLWIRISRSFQFECINESLLKYYVHNVKISTNLDGLNYGLTIMQKKYGRSRAFRKYLSYQRLSLGVRYCYASNTGAARRSYIKAIQLYPFEPRHYFNLFLSLLSAAKFVKIKQAKTGINTSLRKRVPIPASED